MLTEEQINQFHTEGMICIPGFLSAETVAALMKRSHELLHDFDFDNHPKSKFGVDEDNHIGDQYFFDSGDKISYFLDTDAVDDHGNLKYPKEQAVNKIGHGLHMQDKLFQTVTFDERVKAVARDFRFRDPRVLQSMCIFKQPKGKDDKGRTNAVPSHTDATFLYTDPPSALGFWFALEDCTPQNGCLSYNPGSHRTFPLTKRFVRQEKGCGFEPLPYDGPVPEDRPEDYKLVECKAGDLILIHHSVLHKSEDNVSDRSRYAYAFHLIEGEYEYDEKNWLQMEEFSRLFD